MANDAAALGSAIYGAIGSAGTAVGVNLYYALAPQGGAAPYAIFQRQVALDGYGFAGARDVSTDYLVKVVSNKTFPTEARAVYERFDNALQDAALNVSGYRLMRVRRTSQVEYRDTDGYWHVGGLYRIDIVD